MAAESSALKKKEKPGEKEKRGGCKGNGSECMDSSITKETMCAANKEGVCVFYTATMPE